MHEQMEKLTCIKRIAYFASWPREEDDNGVLFHSIDGTHMNEVLNNVTTLKQDAKLKSIILYPKVCLQ
jgi:hypothetical protein